MYNLAGIRDAIFAQTDWAPATSNEAVTRVNEFINRAYYRLALDAPYLFFVDKFTMATEPDVNMAGDTDTISVSAGDAWAMQTDLLVGAPGSTTWNSNRAWDGRVIAIENPDTLDWHEFRIREVVQGERYIITLDRPWRNGSDTGLKWRVQTSEFTLPHDVIEVKAITLRRDQLDYPLQVIGESRAEYASLDNTNRLLQSGVPRWAFRREHQHLRSPTLKPAVGTSAATVWETSGGPVGTFQYLYTYVWGKHEVWFHGQGPLQHDTLVANSTRYLPYWESGPSPESDVVDNRVAGLHITVALPNIDRMLGFDDGSTARYRKAGLKKRIYRRRLTATGDSIESPDRFYLLAEVDGHETSFTDTGEYIPDLGTPFRPIHGYQTMKMYPVPDTRYEAVIRAVRRPLELADDQDVPLIHADGVDALVSRALAYLYESQGLDTKKAGAMRDYEQALFVLAKRYGDMRPKNRSRGRRIASVREDVILRRQFKLVQ